MPRTRDRTKPPHPAAARHYYQTRCVICRKIMYVLKNPRRRQFKTCGSPCSIIYNGTPPEKRAGMKQELVDVKPATTDQKIDLIKWAMLGFKVKSR